MNSNKLFFHQYSREPYAFKKMTPFIQRAIPRRLSGPGYKAYRNRNLYLLSLGCADFQCTVAKQKSERRHSYPQSNLVAGEIYPTDSLAGPDTHGSRSA